jgi:hypothetical protein
MVVTRIFILERIFTKNELLSLDDELPNIKKVGEVKFSGL